MTTESLTDSLRETLALFDGVGTPLTTSEVAEELDLGRRSTYERLDRLAERGRLETKKVGASGRVWWQPAADDGAVVEQLPAMVYRCRNEPGWPMEYVSEACRGLTGHDPEAVESGAVSWGEDVVHPEDREHVRDVVQSGVEGDGRFTVQYRVRTADGKTRWVWERGRVAAGQPGDPAVLEGVITEVTEQKATEAELREQRERFRSLVDAVEEYAIFTLDPDGTVRTWNDGAHRIKGYDREAILGEHFSAFYTREDRAAGVPEGNLAAAAADGSTQDEGWRVRADGTRFWAHVTITAIRDDDGDLLGFAKVTRDTTDRRERERAVREERNLLEGVLETSPTGIGIFEADGEARRVNRRFVELLGLDDAAATEYSLGDRPLRDDSGEPIPFAERPAPRALATGERVDRRVRVDSDDGTRWLSVTAEPLDDATGVVLTTTDVTPLKERTRRLERQREDLEAELEEVFERVDDGFYALDEQFRFTYVNERAEELLDVHEEAVLGESVWDVFPEAVDTPAWEAFHGAMATGERTGFEVYFEPLGFWVATSVYPSESGLSVHFRDVTGRKAREEQLERYAGIIDAVGEPAYELDTEGRFTFVNDAFVEYTGYDESELLGRHISIGMDDAAVEHAEQLLSDLLAEGGTGTATLEHDVVTAEGDRRPVESRFSLLIDEEGRFQGTAGMLWDVSDRRERQRELERYETIVESIDEGVYVVDGDGDFTWVNRAYADMLGYEPAALVGEHVSKVADEETIEKATEYEAALRAGEEGLGLIETELQTADGRTVPVAGTFAMLPDEVGGGRVGVARDVTERKQHEEALTSLHDASRELLRAESAAAVGDIVVEAVTDVLDIPGVGVYRYDEDEELLSPAAKSGDAGFMREEFPSVPPDDSSITGHVFATGEPRLFDDIGDSEHLQADATEMRAGVFAPMGDHGVLIVGSRDAGVFDERTLQLVELLAANAEAAYDRVERERDLEFYETIVETVDDGVYALGADEQIVMVNEALCEMTGYDREELLGAHPTLLNSTEVNEAATRVSERITDGEIDSGALEFDIERADGTTVPVESRFTNYDRDIGLGARCGVIRDVTERKARERALEESRHRYRTLVDNFPNGAVALFDEDLRYLTVGGEMYEGLEFSAADLEGELMAEWVPEELFETVAPRYRAAFDGEECEFEAAYGGEVRQFRVLPVYDEDGAVFAGMTTSQDVTREREREAELERQRERLAALNNLNHVVREITDAVVDQSTREEIEATVCEHIADTDSYLFAWVGDVDLAAETVTLRTEAGVEGYLEDVTLSIDPDDEHGDGPTARALRTGEMQTARDTRTDPEYEPWRDHAAAHGVRSSAAIPIRHEDTTYGVLNVYADRPDAFEGEERGVVGQLGEVVGHAIAAAERKRALMSDEVVELQFRVADVLDAVGVDADGDGTVALDHAVPVGDDEFLYYGRATGDGAGVVEALVEGVPHWTAVTFRDGGADGCEGADGGGDAEADSDGETDFELRLTEPPVLSRVASVGGSVEAAALEDGDFRMTLHLSPTTDVRQVIDVVEESYPAAEMVKRRQTERSEGDRESFEGVVGEGLTDRQRAVLEASVRSGFFEWPRDVSGEDVAESLGVSPPTFHQHLRKAERKVFESLLSASAVEA